MKIVTSWLTVRDTEPSCLNLNVSFVCINVVLHYLCVVSGYDAF